MFRCLSFWLTILGAQACLAQSDSAEEIGKITIYNKGRIIPYEFTNIEGGPCVGNILNAHFFPGVNFFRHANYRYAKEQLDYVIARPHYTQMNPRQAEYMSQGLYMRGVIYLYHATGIGKGVLAKRDFEKSIQWNPKNYASYLELARVWKAVGLNDQAKLVLRRLLSQDPDRSIKETAEKELKELETRVGSVQAPKE
jgi:tetratricopeptide (TPR) repeat protein